MSCQRYGVRVEAMPWASRKRRMTSAFMVTLAKWARILTWKQLSQLLGCSWDTVAAADPLTGLARLKSLEYGEGEIRLTVVMNGNRRPEELISELDKAGLAIKQAAGLGPHGIETTILIAEHR